MSDDAIDAIEARRAARKAARAAEARAQLAADLEALDALEEAHGDSNLKRLDVPFTPGLPTLCVVRTPRPVEIKRYRDQVKPRGPGDVPDLTKAAEAVCAVALVYPAADVFVKMCEARPGLAAQLGSVALSLALGAEAAEGKG